MELKSQFEEARAEIRPGWHNLLHALQDYVSQCQNRYLKTHDNKFVKPDKPIFEFILSTVKEKFAILTIYAHLEEVEHDWNKFDKQAYESQLKETSHNIHGFISGIEAASSFICEESGNLGKRRNVSGWMRTLSDEEFQKSLDKPKIRATLINPAE